MDKLSAYDEISKKVIECRKETGETDLVVLFRMDGIPYEVLTTWEDGDIFDSVTFNNDFWEGEQNIEVELITPLNEVLEFWRDHAKKEDKQC